MDDRKPDIPKMLLIHAATPFSFPMLPLRDDVHRSSKKSRGKKGYKVRKRKGKGKGSR